MPGERPLPTVTRGELNPALGAPGLSGPAPLVEPDSPIDPAPAVKRDPAVGSDPLVEPDPREAVVGANCATSSRPDPTRAVGLPPPPPAATALPLSAPRRLTSLLTARSSLSPFHPPRS